jgi:hypothetical protein
LRTLLCLATGPDINSIVLFWSASKSIENFIDRPNRKSCDKRSQPILGELLPRQIIKVYPKEMIALKATAFRNYPADFQSA